MRKRNNTKTKIQNQIRFIKNQIVIKILGCHQWENWELYKGFRFDKSVSQPELRPENNQYIILLPAESKSNYVKALYEITHEFIHLIFPIPKASVLYFEEGLATKFQLNFIERFGYNKAGSEMSYHTAQIEKIKSDHPQYYQAYSDILKLERLTGKSIYNICNYLISNDLIQSFADVTPELLSEEFGVDINLEVLKRLCSNFYE